MIGFWTNNSVRSEITINHTTTEPESLSQYLEYAIIYDKDSDIDSTNAKFNLLWHDKQQSLARKMNGDPANGL